MAYDIVLGRSKKDVEKLGTRAAVLIGKQYVKMGASTSLSSPVYLDVNTSHVVFVCGKRGSGKSYTMGVIAEGIASLPIEVRNNLAVVLLDTMGIYWTMKYPNHKDIGLLKEWGAEGKGFDVVIYTPAGFFKEFKKKGIPVDHPFAIKPSELSPEDWFLTFGIGATEPLAVFIERIVLSLKERGDNFGISDIIKEAEKAEMEEEHIKNAAINRFSAVETWGVFSADATSLNELVKPGQITVLDMSAYAVMPDGWRIKCLVIGLVGERLFSQRMLVRREEEYKAVQSALHYLIAEKEAGVKEPLVWIAIDEAHEFLPKDSKTAATNALLALLREGRQPGVSLILATQQPGKIHTDVMTQSDVIIAHRVTAQIDVDALGALMQSYLRAGLDQELNLLPRVSGAAIIVDDVNERMYPTQIKPRLTWHGGATPTAITEKKKIFEF